jgi:hypothetical protein
MGRATDGRFLSSGECGVLAGELFSSASNPGGQGRVSCPAKRSRLVAGQVGLRRSASTGNSACGFQRKGMKGRKNKQFGRDAVERRLPCSLVQGNKR